MAVKDSIVANSDLIGPAHVAEAVQYRPRERV